MSKSYRWARKVCSSVAPLVLVGLYAVAAAAAGPAPAPPHAPALQQMLDELRVALGIPHEVRVTLVAHNPLVASVRPASDRPGTFVLSIEQGFLDGLADDEIRAVLAHELGHVWIYTHHPFLQTEEFANRVAMRRIPRGDIERVYAKVWGAGALEGGRAAFLGLDPAPPAADAPGRDETRPRLTTAQQ